MTLRIVHGEAFEVLRKMKADRVDALVTDPPAGLAFMGKGWDDFRRARNEADAGRDNAFGGLSAKGPEYGRAERRNFVDATRGIFEECLRVMKPGAHGLVWAIPKTSHWTATALEDAGFELRDCILHLFGTGFPKSMDVSKALDKAAGAEREVVGETQRAGKIGNKIGTKAYGDFKNDSGNLTAPATDLAKQWDGWGTALKPGQEMWWLVRKPCSEKTVAANVAKWSAGGLNVDGCRVSVDAADIARARVPQPSFGSPTGMTYGMQTGEGRNGETFDLSKGRWPTNLVFSHAEGCVPADEKMIKGDNRQGQRGTRPGGCGDVGMASGDGRPAGPLYGDETVETWECVEGCPVAELDRQSGTLHTHAGTAKTVHKAGMFGVESQRGRVLSTGSSGGASRYFPTFGYYPKASRKDRGEGNTHPTVKSSDLMRWLCRLVTRPGGLVLDPFAGSGSTGVACAAEGFAFVGIEREAEYIEIMKRRLPGATYTRIE